MESGVARTGTIGRDRRVLQFATGAPDRQRAT